MFLYLLPVSRRDFFSVKHNDFYVVKNEIPYSTKCLNFCFETGNFQLNNCFYENIQVCEIKFTY